MAPPPVPAASHAFQALTQRNTAKKSDQPLADDMQEKLKKLLQDMPTLSKLGVIELFAAQNPKCVRAQIKTAFEALTEKAGKTWKLKDA